MIDVVLHQPAIEEDLTAIPETGDMFISILGHGLFSSVAVA